MATIKDIAEKVGCAHSLVSNVLNGSGRQNRVSPEKRDRIIAVARELGYRANLNAKRLVGKSTRTIGIIVSRNISPIANDFVMHITRLLDAEGYKSFFTSCSNAESELKAINNFSDLGFDGIITTFMFNPCSALENATPMVFVGNYGSLNGLSTDFHYGEMLAVRHLIRHGHRNIGFLCDRLKGNPEKYQGYCDALAESSIPHDPRKVLEVYLNADFDVQLNLALEEAGVTAFVASGDEIAGRLINYLRKLDKKVPEDVAIIGCDANFSVLLTTPPLTSISYPARELAEHAVKLLFQRMNSPRDTWSHANIKVKPKLFIGGSCGCRPFEAKSVGFSYPASCGMDFYIWEKRILIGEGYDEKYLNKYCFEE